MFGFRGPDKNVTISLNIDLFTVIIERSGFTNNCYRFARPRTRSIFSKLIAYLVSLLYRIVAYSIYAQVVLDIVDEIMALVCNACDDTVRKGHGIVALIGCNKGVHRCTVTAMTLVSMLNSVVHCGKKVFNVNHLRMDGDNPQDALYSAYRWCFEKTWKLFPLPSTRYAEEAVSDSRVMQENFDTIWKLVSDMNAGLAYTHQLHDIIRRVYAVTGCVKVEDDSDDVRPAKKIRRTAQRASPSARQPSSPPPRPSSSPFMRPSSRMLSTARASTDATPADTAAPYGVATGVVHADAVTSYDAATTSVMLPQAYVVKV